MRYNELMESTGKNVNNLHLANTFWGNPTTELGDLVFNLTSNDLQSLEGIPEYIQFGLLLSNNKLTSLVGSPKKIIGEFDCEFNFQLTSLVGGPEYVKTDCNFSKCGLTSLEGSPQYVGGNFFCRANQLTSFEGAPRKIMGDFRGGANFGITSLKDIHKHLPEVHGRIVLLNCPIVSHILGVFLIKGCFNLVLGGSLININLNDVNNIVNKHIVNGRAGLLPCQAELIAAGFGEYAQI